MVVRPGAVVWMDCPNAIAPSEGGHQRPSLHKIPMPDLYFDDFEVGQRFTTASATLTEEEIIAFARQWDPQYFHIDKAAAQASAYGGIIASGFHTLVTSSRLWLAAGVINPASMGSPGMEEVRWLQPVRPGDALRVEAEVLEVRPSGSKPGRGILRMAYHVMNQEDAQVMSYIIVHIMARREA